MSLQSEINIKVDESVMLCRLVLLIELSILLDQLLACQVRAK